MAQTFQITAVTQDAAGIHVTVSYADSVTGKNVAKSYTFASAPPAADLAAMLNAEGKAQLALVNAVVNPLPVAGAPVPIV